MNVISINEVFECVMLFRFVPGGLGVNVISINEVFVYVSTKDLFLEV